MSRTATPPAVGRNTSLSARSLAPDAPATPRHRPLLATTWGAAIAGVLIVAEFAALSFAIDTGSIVVAGPFAAIVDFSPELVRIALVAVLFVGVLLGPRLLPLTRDLVRAAGDHRSRVRWYGLHLATTVVFGVITAHVCEAARLAGPWGAGWFSLWVGMVAATCGTALAALAPPAFWCRAVRENAVRLPIAVLLGGLAWGAGELTRVGTSDLVDATFGCVATILATAGFDVVADPANHVLGTASFVVHVAPGCSGYEGLGLVLAFVVGFLVLARRRLRFPNALWLLPIGAGLALAANVLRIALLIAIGSTFSPELALGGFHSQAGWVTFNAIAIGTLAVGLTCPVFARREDVDSLPVDVPTSPAGVLLTPLIVWLATGMLLETCCPDATIVYTGRTLAAVVALVLCRRAFDGVSRRVTSTGVLIGVATFVLWTAVGAFEASTETAQLPTDPWWIVARLFGSILVVPVVEELAFRGYLMRRLVNVDVDAVEPRNVPNWAIVVSSIAFGLLHGWFVAGTLAGIVLGLTARRRGLGDAIVAHAVANALVATAALGVGWTWLW